MEKTKNKEEREVAKGITFLPFVYTLVYANSRVYQNDPFVDFCNAELIAVKKVITLTEIGVRRIRMWWNGRETIRNSIVDEGKVYMQALTFRMYRIKDPL